MNAPEIRNNSSLQNSVIFPMKAKMFIYLFIYIFIYTFRLFLQNLICAKLKEFGDSQNQILSILKTFSTHKGIHT